MDDRPGPLRPKEVAEVLRATALALHTDLAGLPAAVVCWHPAAGEWCIKETLGHLIESERAADFAGRIRIILSADEPRLEAWDQTAVARARHDCDADLAELLSAFLDARTSSAALVDGLKPVDLQRGGHHPTVGYLCVADLLHEWIHHDHNHIRQMLAVVQAYVWPSMGSTQRFSQPSAT